MNRLRLEGIVYLYEKSTKLNHSEERIYERCVQIPQMKKYLDDKKRAMKV